MGDRAVVRINGAACAAYLHWNGEEALAWLTEAVPNMREGDPDYSMARLIAFFCGKVPGNTSVGVLPPDSCGHGDAGILTYDCESGSVSASEGYYKSDRGPWPKMIGIPPR